MNDIEAFQNTSMILSNQITDILSKHASASAVNPEKMFTVLGNVITAHILSRTKEKKALKAFREALTAKLEADDDIDDLSKWDLQTDNISVDAAYD
jgi:hypothetical protein